MWIDTVSRILVHDARQTIPTIVDLEATILAVGLEVRTRLRHVYRDVPAPGRAFSRARSEWPVSHPREPWVSVAVSRGHDVESSSFTYFFGEVVTKIGPRPDGWLSLVIPVGTYAVFPIRPRHKAGWPLARAAAKQHIDRRWLPASDYLPTGGIDDLEYHDERSLRRRDPEIDLFVASRPRGRGWPSTPGPA